MKTSGGERPTGIVRTLPSLYGDASVGAKRYKMSLRLLELAQVPAIYIALASQPRIEVLHMYLVIEGRVDVRLNIAGYEAGDARRCWDRTIRKPKVWVVCTGPVVRPAETIPMRGFQGFRYTQDLW